MKRLIIILIAAEMLLLIPFIAMKLTSDVNWSAFDFMAMAFLLLCTGLGIEFALRLFRVTWIRAAAVATVLFTFVMVWGALVHMGG
jgi:hypothetical protein